MAEIPVERKTGGGFPWWLIPLLLLLVLLPLLYFTCGRNPNVVVDNANGNTNRMTTTGNTNANNGTAVVFNEENSIREANERAAAAMAKIYPNGTAQQVVEALNLSAVNFAKGGDAIPEDRKPLLKQAAEQLKKSPADTRVEIGGYTDNDGDPASNLKLSEQRAATVRNQLISDGAPAAMLTTKGYGETNPKASNDTPEGKFQNRRIEYKVLSDSANGANGVNNVNNVNSANAAADTSANGSQSKDAVTAVNFFGFTKDKATLVGRTVDLTKVRVERVLSDRMFTVKSEGEEMFILLAKAIDNRIDNKAGDQVKPGQIVSFKGSFRALPSEAVKSEQETGLTNTELGQMKAQKVYLFADSLTAIN